MKQLSVIIICIYFSVPGMAQKNKMAAENAAAVKEFVTVCNSYKKLPLHIQIRQNNTALIVASEEDTAATDADFYITPQGSYIRYGNTEQVSDDSFRVVVSNDQQLMMIYTSTENIQQQLNMMTGFQMSDSSIDKISEKYSAVIYPVENEQAVVELKNRLPLPGTDLVKESVTIKYNNTTKEPAAVIYMRRSLIPIDSADWGTGAEYAALKDKLIKTKESWFIINERTQTYTYKKIDHDAGIKLPVSIAERIKRTAQGEFVAAKGFEDYYISVDE